MTETKWLACTTDPELMLDFLLLQGKASDRKLRLFAVARCRQLWHLLTDERSRLAVEVGERFADQQATTADLNEAAAVAAEAEAWPRRATVNAVGARVARSAVVERDPTGNDVWDTAWDLGDADMQEALMAAANQEAPILRELFGNPFRPVALDRAWLARQGGVVQKLPQAIYEERAFDRMPILADALEEVGCANADILSHCRSAGPHVRGCWVIDLLLGKQ
jgi:hypothetical protein